MSELVRLNKFLADCGVASRRKCDELIERGMVSVDGRVVGELGVKIDPEAQRVEVRGEVLDADVVRPRYYLLNKPTGVICTNDVREARTRAIDLIDDRRKGRIYTVGRLDEDTTGIVLLTNDGEFANRVMHPRYGVAKTYRVRLRGRIDDAALLEAREGVRLSEGRTTGMRAVVVDRNDRSSELRVSLREGMNREVRRVFAKLGYKVQSLHRERIGELSDRGLKLGQWRPLVRSEVEGLLHPAPVRGERERKRGRREHAEVRRDNTRDRGARGRSEGTRGEGARGGSTRGGAGRGGSTRGGGGRGAREPGVGRERDERERERGSGFGRGTGRESSAGRGTGAGRASGARTRSTGRPFARGDTGPRARGPRAR